jgi:hypothetical protein
MVSPKFPEQLHQVYCDYTTIYTALPNPEQVAEILHS